jgi:hypothetical protein
VSEVQPKKQASNPIQRFPRFRTAGDIGTLARKIWKHPKFRVKLTADSTKFIFSLRFNIRKKIKKKDPASYDLLFDPKRTSFCKAFIQAYREAYSGRNAKARDLCERALYKVFVDSLALLFEEADRTEGLYKGYKGNLSGDASVVRDAAKRKKRPPDLERKRCARRMSARYEELLPKVKELRRFVSDHPDCSDDTKLKVAVQAKYSDKWIESVTTGLALKHLPETSGHPNSTDSLGRLEWTPRQLTVAVIWCEERWRNPNFGAGPGTILEVYLPMGKRLNKASK